MPETNQVLDVLKNFNVTASFFVNGLYNYETDLARYKSTITRIYNEVRRAKCISLLNNPSDICKKLVVHPCVISTFNAGPSTGVPLVEPHRPHQPHEDRVEERAGTLGSGCERNDWGEILRIATKRKEIYKTHVLFLR